MFGFGLVVLMVYSDKVLKEPIRTREYIGTAILVVGTVALGVENIRNPLEDFSIINYHLVWITLGIFLLISGPLLIFSLKKTITFSSESFLVSSPVPPPAWILSSRALASIWGYPGFIPSVPIGWFYFIISFAFSTTQFLLTQLGFLRRAHASVLVPIHNTAYIIFPILIQQVAVPNYSITMLTGVGLGLIIFGASLLHPLNKQKFSLDLM